MEEEMIDWLLEPEEELNPETLYLETHGTLSGYIQQSIRKDYNG